MVGMWVVREERRRCPRNCRQMPQQRPLARRPAAAARGTEGKRSCFNPPQYALSSATQSFKLPHLSCERRDSTSTAGQQARCACPTICCTGRSAVQWFVLQRLPSSCLTLEQGNQPGPTFPRESSSATVVDWLRRAENVLDWSWSWEFGEERGAPSPAGHAAIGQHVKSPHLLSVTLPAAAALLNTVLRLCNRPGPCAHVTWVASAHC